MRTELASAEKLSGGAAAAALKKLATQLDSATRDAGDKAKVAMLSTAVTELAAAR